jgi:hypothetical protein
MARGIGSICIEMNRRKNVRRRSSNGSTLRKQGVVRGGLVVGKVGSFTFKIRLPKRRLRFDASRYITTYKNLQNFLN